MSADNGIIIRQHPTSGKFLVQFYFDSAEDPAMDDCRPEMTFSTLDQAVMSAAKMDDEYPTEYGITISVPGVCCWWA